MKVADFFRTGASRLEDPVGETRRSAEEELSEPEILASWKAQAEKISSGNENGSHQTSNQGQRHQQVRPILCEKLSHLVPHFELY
jgi:hypothetical protein